MIATHKGFISLFRGDSRSAALYLPDLMVTDIVYAQKIGIFIKFSKFLCTQFF